MYALWTGLCPWQLPWVCRLEAGGREEPGYREGMQDSPTLGTMDKAGLGEGTAPTPPGKKDLRPIPCVSYRLLWCVCSEQGARGPWFIFTIGSVSAYVLVPG